MLNGLSSLSQRLQVPLFYVELCLQLQLLSEMKVTVVMVIVSRDKKVRITIGLFELYEKSSEK